MTTKSPLAAPLRLPNGIELPNRLVKSAMSETMGTTDNRVTERLVRLYRAWAEGGVGLAITGNVMADRSALGEPNNVAIEDERDLQMLGRWAQAGKANGAHLWMQINHPGKQSPRGLNKENFAPSAIPFRSDLAAFFSTPRELTNTQIEVIIGRFARTAEIAQKAGFGGVQIHGAHGYLVSQFLSPHHNQRTDDWGGSAGRRRRFVLAVLGAIRAKVGPAFPIGIKLNSADFQRGGFTEEESLECIQALVEAGIDLVEISGGTYEQPAMAGVGMKESTRRREAYFLEFAEKARAVAKIPLMVTGGFRTAAGMAEAVASGSTDLVGLGRLLSVEPDAPLRLLAGQDPRHHIRPISTGIGPVDRMGLMEVQWYARQLRRIADGQSTRPDESALASFALGVVENGWRTFRTRRLRA